LVEIEMELVTMAMTRVLFLWMGWLVLQDGTNLEATLVLVKMNFPTMKGMDCLLDFSM